MTSKRPKRKERSGVDRYGRTPLHHAVSDGDLVRLKELLGSGADPNSPDDDGWTPLHFAAMNGIPDAVILLLEAGAAVDPRDSHGNTPLWRAVFESRGKGEIIKLLRTAGANPYIKNEHAISPLSLARTIANFNVRQFFEDLP
jgi:ankyrin repeat protein